MTQKGIEPTTTMRIPLSFREYIREKARQENTTMLGYVVRKVRGEQV